MRPKTRTRATLHRACYLTNDEDRQLREWQARFNVPNRSDAMRELILAAIELIEWEPAPGAEDAE